MAPSSFVVPAAPVEPEAAFPEPRFLPLRAAAPEAFPPPPAFPAPAFPAGTAHRGGLPDPAAPPSGLLNVRSAL